MRTIDPTRGQHILEAAARLFAQRHYHEVRMDDIADRADVAKGTIYRYFQDKEDLYLALILSGLERLYLDVESAIAATADPEEQLLTYVHRAIHFFKNYPYFLDLAQRVESSMSGEKLQTLKISRQRFFDLVSAVITRLNASGRFFTSDPALAALALTGMIRQILRFHPKPWQDGMAEFVVRQFLHGMQPEPAPSEPANPRGSRRTANRQQVLG